MWVLEESGSTVYVGGQFSEIGGVRCQCLAALDTRQARDGLAPDRVANRADGLRRAAFVEVDAFPNPTSGRTRIQYTLERDAHLQVRIFDVMGREVVQLLDAVRPRGTCAVSWDGSAPSGLVPSLVPSGVYFVHVEADGRVATS